MDLEKTSEMKMLWGLDSKMLTEELGIQMACVERNKDAPVVKLRYDDRMVIWTAQILPDRRHKIAQENTVEYVERMIGLLGNDVRRLAAACERQHVITASAPRVRDLMEVYRTEIRVYAAEITRIEDEENDH